MKQITQKISQINWPVISQSLYQKGYAIIPKLLDQDSCQQLIAGYSNQQAYRKTVPMQRYRFGSGEYKYWHYPLPDKVQLLRQFLYPHLASIANEWMQWLNIETVFPTTLSGLKNICDVAGQSKPTPLILKYQEGGFNTLHQDLYGEVYFPLQAVCVLSQSGRDFRGGELVLTEQMPRAQSKVSVLTPELGDLIIFSTNFRPQKGVRGFYRVTMKHGVSELHSGERYSMGLIFHDAHS